MKKQQQPKIVSALQINPNLTHSNSNYHANNIQYFTNTVDKAYELSDEEKQTQFQRIHQEYLAEKAARKKEIDKRRKDEFGTSSSQDDDIGGSESDSNSEKRQSNLQEEKKFRESQNNVFEKIKAQKCQIYFSIKKIKQAWTLQNIQFDEQSLTIGQKHYFLKEIHKIKIIQGVVVGPNNHKIKLSCLDSSQLFIGASSKPYKNLPFNYFVFAYVIERKLINMGKKLSKNVTNVIPGIPESLIKNSYIYGKIFKKSQILGKWQERLILINKEGIFSYKKFNQKHSMFISSSHLREIWTRFEIDEGLLIIKILHNTTKTQFGIPLAELLDKKSWLFNFYTLAFPE